MVNILPFLFTGKQDMSTILVIDDEQELTDLIQSTLERKGYRVLVTSNGIEGIRMASLHPDLILLDVMMPGKDGFEVVEAIREDVACPILFISARDSELDRVRGLNLGGDDYLVKPFSLKEMLARIEANLRREARSQGRPAGARCGQLFFGDLSLDLKGRQVMMSGQIIPLTRREYEVVELLALHPGQVFSREQIYEQVWGYDAEGDAATVMEHVKNIRTKFQTAQVPGERITTVWGIGYRWEKNVQPRPAADGRSA
jgi:DNA-binding response OmpR family regulator